MHSTDLNLISKKRLGIIMGGGAGNRLFPLAKDRSNTVIETGHWI